MSEDKQQKVSAKPGPTGLQESLNVTPVFANMTNVTVAGEVTRIAFGETYGGVSPKYHTAVALPTHAALELAKLIQQVVGAHLQRIESEANEAGPKGPLN